jgi:uncharacterized integral membrane protein (TIGR00698 family)
MSFDDQDTKRASKAYLTILPGFAACAAIAALSAVAEALETKSFGHPYVESLVVAIILGMAVRIFWHPSDRWLIGISFCSRRVLEVAVVLFGGALSFATISASGVMLIGAIVVIMSIALALSYALSRVLGLSKKMSILVACGNSICGNSAIAAVAPIIRANGNEVGASIAFTAVLGVAAVLALPLFAPLLGLSEWQFGVLAGMTVYAVPQVLPATVPVGLVSAQIGTFVKLLRVLMLGPVVIALSAFVKFRSKGEPSEHQHRNSLEWLPWFIPGFFFLATLRSFDLLPIVVTTALSTVAIHLMVISMAALGLSVDLRQIVKVGAKATAAVTLSLVVLFLTSLAAILWLF